jgi:predicted RNA binding protein YcfA (HicA-like mRNA interferase family)
MKYRDVTNLIEDDGWRVVRQRGSHKHYRHPKKQGLVTIAGADNDDVPPKTLDRICDQAQIPRIRRK